MMDLGGRQGPSGAAGGSKIRADFQFTPTRAQPASETPRTHPYVIPKDHHGTKGFFEFGFVEKLLRVLRASQQSKPNFPPEAAYPFTGAPIGEFVSYQANRENSEIIGGGVGGNPQNEIYGTPAHLWHTPPKKISFACGGLVLTLIFTFILPLFLPLFVPSKKFSSPAAGFFLRLVYLCFYLCF